MANLGPTMHGHVTNPANPGQNFPGYLAGYPSQPVSKKKGRRDKPYIKFHIGFLELANPKPKTQPKVAIPDHQPKPYRPIKITDWINNPPGSGKAAKKARRRALKRAARALAKEEAAEEELRAKERGEADQEELAREKQKRDRELYLSIKKDMSERAERENQIKTRSVSRKIKEEKKAARERKKREMEEEKKRSEIRKGKRRASDVEVEEAAAAAAAASSKNKGKRGADDGEDDRRNKIKFVHDEDLDSLFSDDDSDTDSLFGDKRVPEDPVKTLPDLGSEAPKISNMPQEVLERIVDYCDPVSLTLLGLTSKRFGQLAITHGAGFPSIRNRYGGDLERHRCMNILEPWMNRAYTEAPEPITVVEQTERNKLKKLRLCYICRKYLPISGKKCQYWKNCPKKDMMPLDPDSQAARRTEIERRRAAASNQRGGGFAALLNSINPVPFGGIRTASGAYIYGRYKPLPKMKKVKPKAQEFVWEDEDWTTLSVGVCKSRKRIQDVKSICPKCTLTVHTVHLGWPPETPVVRWLEEGNPLGGRMSMGHEPQSGAVNDTELDEVEMEVEDEEDGEVGGPSGTG